MQSVFFIPMFYDAESLLEGFEAYFFYILKHFFQYVNPIAKIKTLKLNKPLVFLFLFFK